MEEQRIVHPIPPLYDTFAYIKSLDKKDRR